MKRNTKIATMIAVGGIAGGALAAGPVLAANDPSPSPRPPGMGQMIGGNGGPGQMMGRYGGGGPGVESCPQGTGGWLGTTAPKGTLTSAQKTTLAAIAEREKLAYDLYTAFAARYDAPVFDHFAVAESRHLTAVRALLDRYGVPDPTKGKPAGAFGNAQVKATYAKLLAQGNGGEQAALRAGQAVEKADVDALTKAVTGLAAPDVQQLYTRLLHSSQMHLTLLQR
jgi:hypothetical protein